MSNTGDIIDSGDPFNLSRFTKAQEGVYGRAMAELNAGHKRTHWMWFIFPQIEGLGHSSISRRYAIKRLIVAGRSVYKERYGIIRNGRIGTIGQGNDPK